MSPQGKLRRRNYSHRERLRKLRGVGVRVFADALTKDAGSVASTFRRMRLKIFSVRTVERS